ncbi:MAG: hypothetical protein GXP61_03065 [Epsilonproteobacteria bacterium]|nr:hypothetical protein [Campylobacterota bacterium]
MAYELLHLSCKDEYKNFYEENYCKNPTMTFDNISVYFKKGSFHHAFFESSDKRGADDIFSQTRATRIGWIKKILQSPNATLYQGWNSKKRTYDPCGRVALEYEEFVVIVRLSLNKKDRLKANFITCYQANNSIAKIKTSPLWDKEECIKRLRCKKNGR